MLNESSPLLSTVNALGQQAQSSIAVISVINNPNIISLAQVLANPDIAKVVNQYLREQTKADQREVDTHAQDKAQLDNQLAQMINNLVFDIIFKQTQKLKEAKDRQKKILRILKIRLNLKTWYKLAEQSFIYYDNFQKALQARILHLILDAQDAVPLFKGILEEIRKLEKRIEEIKIQRAQNLEHHAETTTNRLMEEYKDNVPTDPEAREAFKAQTKELVKEHASTQAELALIEDEEKEIEEIVEVMKTELTVLQKEKDTAEQEYKTAERALTDFELSREGISDADNLEHQKLERDIEQKEMARLSVSLELDNVRDILSEEQKLLETLELKHQVLEQAQQAGGPEPESHKSGAVQQIKQIAKTPIQVKDAIKSAFELEETKKQMNDLRTKIEKTEDQMTKAITSLNKANIALDQSKAKLKNLENKLQLNLISPKEAEQKRAKLIEMKQAAKEKLHEKELRVQELDEKFQQYQPKLRELRKRRVELNERVKEKFAGIVKIFGIPRKNSPNPEGDLNEFQASLNKETKAFVEQDVELAKEQKHCEKKLNKLRLRAGKLFDNLMSPLRRDLKVNSNEALINHQDLDANQRKDIAELHNIHTHIQYKKPQPEVRPAYQAG